MEAFINFLNEYGILSAVITALGTVLGLFVKWLYNKTIGNRVKEETKERIARVVVKYTEQVWNDLHGEEKLEKALEAFSEMLTEKGIAISDLEMRVYLEAALAEFNNAFNKEKNKDTTKDTSEDI